MSKNRCEKQFHQSYTRGNVVYVKDFLAGRSKRGMSTEEKLRKLMIAVILTALFGFYIFAIVTSVGNNRIVSINTTGESK